MTNFLITLIKLSLSGSLLAGLLILLRLLFRNRVSQTVFYSLWLLVLLRLCVPVGLTISLPAIFGEADVPAASDLSSEPVEGALPGGAENGFAADSQSATDAAGASPTGIAERVKGWNWSAFLVVLWAVVTAARLAWYALSYLRFSASVKRQSSPPSSEAVSVLNELDSAGRIGLSECPLVSTPMLLGVLHPVIILPVGIEGQQRLRDILAHELTHARRHDLLYKWFAVAVTCLHWFNPMMLPVRREINRTCELSCDETVIRSLDRDARRHYSQTLLALAASPSSGKAQLTLTLCEEKEQLKERLVSIVNYRKKGLSAIILTLLLALIMTGCSLVSGTEPTAAPQKRENGVFPSVTAGGVLDLPWGCTFEEFAAEYEGDYDVYDQAGSDGGKFVFLSKTIDGREIDYRLSFDSFDECEIDYGLSFSTFEDLTGDENNAVRLFEASFSPKNEEDKEAISAAITADMGEKKTEFDTLSGNSYGLPHGLWVSGESVYNTLSEEQREKALKRGEENDNWLITEDYFYANYPLSVTDHTTSDYDFSADARWGVMLQYWLENY